MKKLKLMKKIFYIIAIFFLASCSDLLEEQSYDFLVPSSYYKTEADAESAIIGVYNTMITYGFYKQGYWEFGFDCDHASGPTWLFGAIGVGNFLGYWGVDNIWNDHYLMISRANSVLENVAGMDINPDVKQRVLGEAYFFRAFAYFDLVRMYGGVPIRLHTVASGLEPASMPRATVMETYEQIISDFKAAESMLFPYENSLSGGIGHVTKDVASAYLAKTYATIASGGMSGVTIEVLTAKVKEGDNLPYGRYPFQKNVVTGLEEVNSLEYYQLAKEKSEEVINTSGRTLFPNFMDNFKQSNRHKNENMLMCEFTGPSKYSEDALVQVHSGLAIFGPGNGGGWYWGSRNFYNNYLEQGTKLDERALYGINHQPTIAGKYYFPEEDTEYATDGYVFVESQDKAYTTKYDDISIKIVGSTDARYPILRLSDVYLLNAEANNELDNFPEAYASLNEVRRRAKTLDAPSGMDKDELRSFILEERGREFFAENNNRRDDLLRWGIYLEVMNFMNSDKYGIVKARTEQALLLPIPQSEINSNDEIGVNNPGW
jgi:starch-binding outer membrane protein, SusD/RagB family